MACVAKKTHLFKVFEMSILIRVTDKQAASKMDKEWPIDSQPVKATRYIGG